MISLNSISYFRRLRNNATMRLSKIYTKVGDKGKTMLADGSKIPKSSIRIHCYGTVDELNSFAGLLRDKLNDVNPVLFNQEVEQLTRIQNELFDVGGELSTPASVLNVDRQQVVSNSSIEALEEEMDQMNSSLSPLENFVLPGGDQAISFAHVCRTVCRRAERFAVEMGESEEVREEPKIYLNRLSDWFFVLARTISRKLGVPEPIWQQSPKNSR